MLRHPVFDIKGDVYELGGKAMKNPKFPSLHCLLNIFLVADALQPTPFFPRAIEPVSDLRVLTPCPA